MAGFFLERRSRMCLLPVLLGGWRLASVRILPRRIMWAGEAGLAAISPAPLYFYQIQLELSRRDNGKLKSSAFMSEYEQLKWNQDGKLFSTSWGSPTLCGLPRASGSGFGSIWWCDGRRLCCPDPTTLEENLFAVNRQAGI